MTTTEAEFWKQAARRGLPWFRFLRRPVDPESLDRRFRGSFLEQKWLRLRAKIEPGDRIWPFEFHVRRYLGLRRGYVVLRRGCPIGGVVTELS